MKSILVIDSGVAPFVDDHVATLRGLGFPVTRLVNRWTNGVRAAYDLHCMKKVVKKHDHVIYWGVGDRTERVLRWAGNTPVDLHVLGGELNHWGYYELVADRRDTVRLVLPSRMTRNRFALDGQVLHPVVRTDLIRPAKNEARSGVVTAAISHVPEKKGLDLFVKRSSCHDELHVAIGFNGPPGGAVLFTPAQARQRLHATLRHFATYFVGSPHESFGVVIMEAAAAGCKVEVGNRRAQIGALEDLDGPMDHGTITARYGPERFKAQVARLMEVEP